MKAQSAKPTVFSAFANNGNERVPDRLLEEERRVGEAPSLSRSRGHCEQLICIRAMAKNSNGIFPLSPVQMRQCWKVTGA